MERILNLSLLTPELTISRILARITPVSPGRKNSPVWVWKTHICEGKAKGGKAYCSSSHKPHSLLLEGPQEPWDARPDHVVCVVLVEGRRQLQGDPSAIRAHHTNTQEFWGGPARLHGGMFFPKIPCCPFQLTPYLPERGSWFVPTMTTGCLVSNPLLYHLIKREAVN